MNQTMIIISLDVACETFCISTGMSGNDPLLSKIISDIYNKICDCKNIQLVISESRTSLTKNIYNEIEKMRIEALPNRDDALCTLMLSIFAVLTQYRAITTAVDGGLVHNYLLQEVKFDGIYPMLILISYTPIIV